MSSLILSPNQRFPQNSAKFEEFRGIFKIEDLESIIMSEVQQNAYVELIANVYARQTNTNRDQFKLLCATGVTGIEFLRNSAKFRISRNFNFGFKKKRYN